MEPSGINKILLASFGSGAGSDAFSLIVDDNIVEKRKNSIPLREKLNDNVEINYGTYAKIRGILDR